MLVNGAPEISVANIFPNILLCVQQKKVIRDWNELSNLWHDFKHVAISYHIISFHTKVKKSKYPTQVPQTRYFLPKIPKHFTPLNLITGNTNISIHAEEKQAGHRTYKPEKPQLSQITTKWKKWLSQRPNSSINTILHPTRLWTLHPPGVYWNLVFMTQDAVFRKAWHHVLFHTDTVGPQKGMRLSLCTKAPLCAINHVKPAWSYKSLLWGNPPAPCTFTKWWGLWGTCPYTVLYIYEYITSR